MSDLGWVVEPADPDIGRFTEVAYHEGGEDDYIAALINEEERS